MRISFTGTAATTRGVLSGREPVFKLRREILSSRRSRWREPVAGGLVPAWALFPLGDGGSCDALPCSAPMTLRCVAKGKGFCVMIKASKLQTFS